MQPLIAENDAVVSLVDATAQLVGESATRVVEAGTTGSVVAIHLQGSHVAAYEVEFHLGDNSWGLATFAIGEVELPSSGRLYHAVVWQQAANSTGLRVAVCAESLSDASSKLEAKYGRGSVFNLHNREDSERLR
jgi:hypothetical protein